MTHPLELLTRCRALLGQVAERRTADWPHPRTLALPSACTREVLDDLLRSIDATLVGAPRDYLDTDREAALRAVLELPPEQRDQLLADVLARPR